MTTARRPLRTVLLSGGVDSSCLLALCADEHDDDLEALFVDYGQGPARREDAAATALAKTYGAELRRASITIGPIGPGEIPARNALLLHVALATARARPTTIMIGIHAGTPYLDCSPEFLAAMRVSFDLHRGGAIQLAAPFISWSKSEVYAYAQAMSVPLELTYSCETSDTPCGTCPSCLDREMLDAG
jgi:7-cyano-7-deazaguanine synthase